LDDRRGDRLSWRRFATRGRAAGLGAWSFGAAVLAVGSRPDGGVKLAAYETLDLRARWRFTPQWQLEAKLLNATDRDIEPARGYQSIGRQAWIGVRYDGKGL